MVEEQSLEELIDLLASCRLDSRRASYRHTVINDTLQRLQVDSLADLKGMLILT